MKWAFNKILHMKYNDLGRTYEMGLDLGNTFRSISLTHDNCSINHDDLTVAFRLKIESVLFQNRHNEQRFVPLEKAIEFYKKGEKRNGKDGPYVVIPWHIITEANEFPDEQLPF